MPGTRCLLQCFKGVRVIHETNDAREIDLWTTLQSVRRGKPCRIFVAVVLFFSFTLRFPFSFPLLWGSSWKPSGRTPQRCHGPSGFARVYSSQNLRLLIFLVFPFFFLFFSFVLFSFFLCVFLIFLFFHIFFFFLFLFLCFLLSFFVHTFSNVFLRMFFFFLLRWLGCVPPPSWLGGLPSFLVGFLLFLLPFPFL